MIDLKHEIERELSLIDPPDLWERIQANAENHDILVRPLPIDAWDWRRRSRWLAAVAVVMIVLAVVALKALSGAGTTVDTSPAFAPPTSESPTTSAPLTMLELAALEEGRQFRVGNLIVTIQCTATKSAPGSPIREVVLGGAVTENPDNLATLDEVSVAVGDLLALIIRDQPDLGRRVTLYDNTQWFGGAPISSCDELVDSVPTWVDGGFFNGGIPGGYEILPGGASSEEETTEFKLATIHGAPSTEDEFASILDMMQSGAGALCEPESDRGRAGDLLVSSWEQSGKTESLLVWSHAVISACG